MRLSIRAKQVLGVTALVGAVVTALSVHTLAEQARVRLEESQARGQLLARAIYQRSRAVVPTAADPYAAIRDDGGADLYADIRRRCDLECESKRAAAAGDGARPGGYAAGGEDGLGVCAG